MGYSSGFSMNMTQSLRLSLRQEQILPPSIVRPKTNPQFRTLSEAVGASAQTSLRDTYRTLPAFSLLTRPSIKDLMVLGNHGKREIGLQLNSEDPKDNHVVFGRSNATTFIDTEKFKVHNHPAAIYALPSEQDFDMTDDFQVVVSPKGISFTSFDRLTSGQWKRFCAPEIFPHSFIFAPGEALPVTSGMEQDVEKLNSLLAKHRYPSMAFCFGSLVPDVLMRFAWFINWYDVTGALKMNPEADAFDFISRPLTSLLETAPASSAARLSDQQMASRAWKRALIKEKEDPIKNMEDAPRTYMIRGKKMTISASRIAYAKKETVTAIVSQDPSALSLVSEALRNDREVVLAAVSKDGTALRYASKELKGDKEVVLAAMSNNKQAINYAAQSLFNDKQSLLSLIKESGRGLSHASEALKNDREVVLAAVQKDTEAFHYASEKCRDDKEIVIAAVSGNGNLLSLASKRLKNDDGVVMAAVSQDGRALQHASERIRNNMKIVLAAVSNAGTSLQYASENLKHNRSVVLVAVLQTGQALRYAPEEMQSDREIVFAAVTEPVWHDGWSEVVGRSVLRYVSESLRNDKQVVLLSVRYEGYALKYASERLRGDKEVVLAAISGQKNEHDLSPLEYATESLRDDKEVVLAAVTKDPGSLQYASDRLKNDADIMHICQSDKK